jgi:hypothetical protein
MAADNRLPLKAPYDYYTTRRIMTDRKEKTKRAPAVAAIGSGDAPAHRPRMIIEIERTIRVRRIPGGFVPRREMVRDMLTALKLTGNRNKKSSGRSES